MDEMKTEVMEESMEDLQLPAGIKTDTVLKYLGDLSGALSSIANDINQTIVNVIQSLPPVLQQQLKNDIGTKRTKLTSTITDEY